MIVATLPMLLNTEGSVMNMSERLLAAVPVGALPLDPVPAVITVPDCGDGFTMDVRPRRNPEALGTAH